MSAISRCSSFATRSVRILMPLYDVAHATSETTLLCLLSAARYARLDFQFTLRLNDLVGFDDVAHLDVVVVLDAHAALVATLHLAYVVFETLERRKLPVVDDHRVAHEPHLVVAVDASFGDVAPGDGADFGHLEDLADSGVAEDFFRLFGREHAFERVADVFD